MPSRRAKQFIAILLLVLLGEAGIPVPPAVAAVPRILHHQGRLYDAGGNLLGGGGTDYCFKFSIWDDAAVGMPDNRLWPATAPSSTQVTVRNGVFSAYIGDTTSGGDVLDFNFQDASEAYLQVEVGAKSGATCSPADGAETYETLSPRQRIAATGYAINSETVDGYSAQQAASGDLIPVLSSGNLVLGGTDPQINATGTNTLTLQGGSGTGNINFFSAANSINANGVLSITSLQLAATTSQLTYGVPSGGTRTVDLPDFADATDTLVAANAAQSLRNKSLINPELFGTVSLNQSGPAMALFVNNSPTSTQSTSTVAITAGSNVAGSALRIENYGTGNAFEVLSGTTNVFSLNASGTAAFRPATDTSGVFLLQNAAATETLFTADAVSNVVKIGDSSGAGTPTTLLTLDTKADDGDPTGYDGAMYYRSSTQRFRCFEGGVWTNCIPNSFDYQPHFMNRRWGFWRPLGLTATTFTTTGLVAPTASGTVTASAQADDYYIRFASVATNNLSAGVWQNALAQTQGRYRPRLVTKIRTDAAIDNRRIWVALTNAALAPTNGTGALATRYVGVRYAPTAGDTTWHCASGDGTTGSDLDTGVTVSPSTPYQIMVDWTVDGRLRCGIQTADSDWVWTDKTTNLDTTQTANLGIYNIMTTLTAAIRYHYISYVYLGDKD